MAKRRKQGRPLDGVLLFDKPSGISSNQALQQVKRLYYAQKAGHTGSLDPLASGLLPICFGEATKFSHYLLAADKGYYFQAKLGERTTTSDADGEIVSSSAVNVTGKQLDDVVSAYRGKIQQIPSMYSALKHKGKPLYKYAREGIEIERESRPIEVYRLEITEHKDSFISGFVHCSKGTYVRTLIDDIGQDLGCGAHLTQLRRSQVGDFDGPGVTLEQLEKMKDEKQHPEMDALLLPVDSGLQHFPKIELGDDLAYYMRFGQAVFIPGVPANTLLRLYHAGTFIGLGELDNDGKVAPRRLCVRNEDAPATESAETPS
ncbi:MAG: tRNA pseudouridine(55) synthase TruB [Kangiellaceae bacterium]|nr:tRNA pseudouridine(55) synthase TruB [Kangiellaceae bacterium]|tara:strand:+ start:983 stop:1933 length:951 start_codon:yes stop_codon:yes gene_type:complete